MARRKNSNLTCGYLKKDDGDMYSILSKDHVADVGEIKCKEYGYMFDRGPDESGINRIFNVNADCENEMVSEECARKVVHDGRSAVKEFSYDDFKGSGMTTGTDMQGNKVCAQEKVKVCEDSERIRDGVAREDAPFSGINFPKNISKERYEEHTKRVVKEIDSCEKEVKKSSYCTYSESKDVRKAAGCYVEDKKNTEDRLMKFYKEEPIRGFRERSGVDVEKEKNMREMIKIQEKNLKLKDQEILLLRQKVAALEANMKLEGCLYIEECVNKGEEAVDILYEEIKEERRTFQRKIEEEEKTSKALSKQVNGLKKVISELVVKVKRAKCSSQMDM